MLWAEMLPKEGGSSSSWWFQQIQTFYLRELCVKFEEEAFTIWKTIQTSQINSRTIVLLM